MTARRLSLALICATLLTAHSAHADSIGMRCGAQLIVKGFHETQVRALCGEPDAVSTYHYHVHTGPNSSDNHRDIPVTEFVYNFGPRKFMRLLRFENGRLVRIESLGYGYN